MSTSTMTTQTNNEQIIYCARSGVPLCKVTKLNRGGWPLTGATVDGILHPIYNSPATKLIKGLQDHVRHLHGAGFKLDDNNHWRQQDIALHLSAIMHEMDAIWTPPAGGRDRTSLPSWLVSMSCAVKLLDLASWYFYESSQRMRFPLYRVHPNNNNMQWNNFNGWLEVAEGIRVKWQSGKEEMLRDAEIKSKTDALLEVRARNVWKKLDLMKVWNWIDIQMAVAIPAAKREDYKTLFLKGDSKPEDYLMADVDDFIAIILDHCDIGNEIMHFIQERMRMVRSIIQEFCTGYRLITDVMDMGGLINSESERNELAVTTATLAKFAGNVTELTELPPAPERKDFDSNAKFLQAQARWNITKREWDKQQARNAAAAKVVSPATVTTNIRDAL